ncbi:MAG TPA: 2,3-diaminopropionate biosynthesis protein SbnB [Thermoanaerobaculia bacterium]|nr:2,3-diaminopropionate biosynthesis protein SbnB [Thermoanaerobaculia bacterium]
MGRIRFLSGDQVAALLNGREQEILDAVAEAYLAHQQGQSSLPHSSFLRFPDQPRDRIISLAAYLGGATPVAGLKWIASFPGNLDQGLPRASAVMVLNSATTGLPLAILEASLVSARRTAASAALAAQRLVAEPPASAGLIAAGPINFEVARFLSVVFPGLSDLAVFDLSRERAEAFVRRCRRELPRLSPRVVATAREAMTTGAVLCYATTAGEPHVRDLSACPPGTVILHVSLRDLAPEVILAANNVVDDVDHVARAQTSIHLTEQQAGSRQFIWCSLGEILAGAAPPRPHPGGLTIFSPFGLGILDLAVARLVLEKAERTGQGLDLPFLPTTGEP